VCVLVRFNQVARLIVNANHDIMSWLLVERLVQVNNDDIGMPRNVKEIREDLDRLPSFHLRLWRLCLNLLVRCFMYASGTSIFSASALLVGRFERSPPSTSRTAGVPSWSWL